MESKKYNLIRALDPETAEAIQAIENSPELDAELDAVSEVYSDLVGDLPLFCLKGRHGLWARSQDVAPMLELRAEGLSERVSTAEAGGDIDPGQVARGVRDEDVDWAQSPSTGGDCETAITTSPRGVMMISLDGIIVLAMRSSGGRGVRLRKQIKAILDAFPKLQRLCVRLLRDRAAPKPPSAVFDILREEERQLEAMQMRVARFQRLAHLEGERDQLIAELGIGARLLAVREVEVIKRVPIEVEREVPVPAGRYWVPAGWSKTEAAGAEAAGCTIGEWRKATAALGFRGPDDFGDGEHMRKVREPARTFDSGASVAMLAPLWIWRNDVPDVVRAWLIEQAA